MLFSCWRAHPRSRGENELAYQIGELYWGSSPLTRGKRNSRRLADHRSGLIPAHAGKTDVRAPRVRAYQGSSPLTRGKQGLHERLFGCLGLIPAHAGKTWTTLIPSLTPAAHPRSRGENLNLVMIDEAWAGSSPLTRGKPQGLTTVTGMPRLIPAHAGKTNVCE